MKIFSVDAETNGLYGEAFAIGVVVRDDEKEIARFDGRCPDSCVTDPWVQEFVLPMLKGMEITHASPNELEEAFWHFWMNHRAEAVVIAHCGSPVESGLFRRCVERDTNHRKFSGPYPAIHDVATMLLYFRREPDSVDTYLNSIGEKVPFDGRPHHPVYDAIAAAIAWEHLVG